MIDASRRRERLGRQPGRNRARSGPGIKSLKVGFNKVFGYYIEVSHANAENVPDDYIRKQTLVNAERYITPELKEYETLILNAEERMLEIERRLFRGTLRAVGRRTAARCCARRAPSPSWTCSPRWPKSPRGKTTCAPP